jgi:hypothetical protein
VRHIPGNDLILDQLAGRNSVLGLCRTVTDAALERSLVSKQTTLEQFCCLRRLDGAKISDGGSCQVGLVSSRCK